jgi:tRNA pseudouridine55 synthase
VTDKKMKRDVSGWLVLDKPYDMTSTQAVGKVRWLFGAKKAGHAGTLDPLATGLLIICTGKMTKRIEEFMGLEKEYTGTFVLGQTTPSHDLETTVQDQRDISGLTEEMIRSATKNFTGKISQLPPAHSAIRVGGRRAYQFARQGKEIELQPRDVEVSVFEITSLELPNVNFRIVCSKGTYIRSIARDYGDFLGVGAYLSRLCRTRIGDFRLEDALEIENVV